MIVTIKNRYTDAGIRTVDVPDGSTQPIREAVESLVLRGANLRGGYVGADGVMSLPDGGP